MTDISDLEQELEEASTGTPAKRLNPAQWEEIIRLWEFGTVTLQELSDRFGIRRDTIHKRLKELGAVKGSRAHEIGDRTEEEIIDNAIENTRRIHETKETHYKYADALAKMVMQEVIKARQEKRPLVSIDGNLAALNKAAKTLETILKQRYVVLGLDKQDADPEDLPELLVSEMTPDMIEKMQAKMREATNLDFSELEDIEEEEDTNTVVETGNDG